MMFTILPCIKGWAMYEEQEEKKGTKQITKLSLSEKAQNDTTYLDGNICSSFSYSGPQWGLPKDEIEYLFETSDDFICVIEFGGHFKKVNKIWKQKLGWEIQELLSTPYIDLVQISL